MILYQQETGRSTVFLMYEKGLLYFFTHVSNHMTGLAIGAMIPCFINTLGFVNP